MLRGTSHHSNKLERSFARSELGSASTGHLRPAGHRSARVTQLQHQHRLQVRSQHRNDALFSIRSCQTEPNPHVLPDDKLKAGRDGFHICQIYSMTNRDCETAEDPKVEILFNYLKSLMEYSQLAYRYFANVNPESKICI